MRPHQRPIFRSPLALCWLGVASFALAGPACVSVTWRDRALRERPDRETPQKTFETLRAALRLDDPILAYFTLSEAMKEREHFTLLEFTLGWDVFFRRYPSARLFGNAEIDRSEMQSDKSATLWASAYGHTMKIDFVRQIYFELKRRDGTSIERWLVDLNQHISHAQNRDDVMHGVVLDPDLKGVNVDDIVSFKFATEWRVLDFVEVTTETKPQESPTDRTTKDP